MRNTLGNLILVTLFGESHGEAIGAVLDGIPAGIKIDNEFIAEKLALRRPSGTISTTRSEKDEFKILSGIFEGKTTGTSICIVIPNSDTNSKDYSADYGIARPSHADYSAYCRYGGNEDYRGGGHFSGRITAALVAVGAIAQQILINKNIYIGSHLLSIAGVKDTKFSLEPLREVKATMNDAFPVLNASIKDKMLEEIIKAKEDGDSVGGVIETAVCGLSAGIGEPWFDTVEGMISKAIFSIPAIKGIQFGDGFSLCEQRGSVANDPFAICDGKVVTTKNSNGGINGGITNGMPIIFSSAVKPTPSIAKTQSSVNFLTIENAEKNIQGRHDPCIAHRACAVINSVTALVICDALAMRFGTDFLGEN